jgi:hypothetical protein
VTPLPSISGVHLRRALLLFAIVLGLAAFAASVTRPGDDSGDTERSASPPTQGEPTVSPGTSGETALTIRFNAEREQVRRLEVGRAATLQVSVDEPGQVEVPLLDLAAPAEPVTPARFEIFASEAGRYPITFTPAASEESLPAGILDVTPAGP